MQNAFPLGKYGYISKGLYRFATHKKANQQDEYVLLVTWQGSSSGLYVIKKELNHDW